MNRRRLLAAAATVAVVVAAPAVAGTRIGSSSAGCDWSTGGRDVRHTYSVPDLCTDISRTTAPTLAPSWFLPTKDSISASPVVVGDTLYVGSWDGIFYAVDVDTGKPRWTFQVHTTTRQAFGRIVSTASVQSFPDPSAASGQRLVVLFGGASSLWALDARTGKELTHLDIDPRDEATQKATGGADQTVEVESSPVVGTVRAGGRQVRRIFFGMDVHNDRDVGRTGVVSARLTADRAGHWTLAPVWKFDPETTHVYVGRDGLTTGSGEGFGCGGVWSSPALDLERNLVAFGSASCSYPEDAKAAGENTSEAIWAIDAGTGKLVWRFRPETTAAGAHRDDDFGASPNVFTTRRGTRVIGEGRKDACYYARVAKTGKPLWRRCTGTAGDAGSNFAIGGFLGTPAVETDGNGHALRVIGATAIPVPRSAGEAVKATAAVNAIDASSGALLWTYRLAGPSYGSTSVAGGVALVADTTTSSLIALNTATGLPLGMWPVIGPPSSAPATVGDSVYLTTGTRETDLEYKAFGLKVQELESIGGSSPLSPLSGIYRLSLPTG